MAEPQGKSTDFKSYLTKLENILEEYLVKKAPGLPDNVKEIIVKFAPWVTLIMMIMTIPVILAVFGLGAMLLPLSVVGGVNYGVSYIISLIFTAIIIILELIAIPGLFKRAKSAWYLVFYSSLVSIVQNLVALNLGGLIIGGLVSLYILFQVKAKYK